MGACIPSNPWRLRARRRRAARREVAVETFLLLWEILARVELPDLHDVCGWRGYVSFVDSQATARLAATERAAEEQPRP